MTFKFRDGSSQDLEWHIPLRETAELPWYNGFDKDGVADCIIKRFKLHRLSDGSCYYEEVA